MGHHSVHNHPKKGKRTRKKRNTKTLPKTQILHSRICRFFHFIHFFLIPFFKVIYHGLCIIVFRNIHKKGKEQEKKDRPKPPQKFKFHIPGYVVFFFFFFFFKVIYHGLCITVWTVIPKKGKEQEKKEIPKPPQKFKFHIPGYAGVFLFFFFFFLSNLSWIMHHSVHNHPKKGKRTRKKR